MIEGWSKLHAFLDSWDIQTCKTDLDGVSEVVRHSAFTLLIFRPAYSNASLHSLSLVLTRNWNTGNYAGHYFGQI